MASETDKHNAQGSLAAGSIPAHVKTLFCGLFDFRVEAQKVSANSDTK